MAQWSHGVICSIPDFLFRGNIGRTDFLTTLTQVDIVVGSLGWCSRRDSSGKWKSVWKFHIFWISWKYGNVEIVDHFLFSYPYYRYTIGKLASMRVMWLFDKTEVLGPLNEPLISKSTRSISFWSLSGSSLKKKKQLSYLFVFINPEDSFERFLKKKNDYSFNEILEWGWKLCLNGPTFRPPGSTILNFGSITDIPWSRSGCC